jgi:hypothetical protein
MARAQQWWRGGIMVLITLSGLWGGQASAGAPSPRRIVAGSTDLVLNVSASNDGGLLLSATTPDLSFRKVVYSDGRYTMQIEHGRDRLVVSGSSDGVVVTRGTKSITYSPERNDPSQGVDIRRLLLDSPAAAAFRALAADLDTAKGDGMEVLGLRISGAVLGELDGDVGATRRLGRDLLTKLGAGLRAASSTTQDCWAVYEREVTRASWDLQFCMQGFAPWNPMRQACAFAWAVRVEGLWFGYLACVSFPVGGNG